MTPQESNPSRADRIEIVTADGTMPAWLWTPAAPTGPGVVVVQEIFGVSDYIRSRAGDLARLGYVVCVPEVYWRLDGEVDEQAPDSLEQSMALAGQVDWPLAVTDVQAAVNHLRGRIEVVGGVGLVGFCFGGGLAFNVAAVEPVDALVSYYGSALPQLLDLAPAVTAPSLHHFGLDDQFIPLDQIRRIQAAVTATGARFETYPGAGHAFDNPRPPFHHAEASEQAWGLTVRFLADHLNRHP